MLKKGFIKPNLTIEKIGKKQFWIGLLLGLFFAFIISLLFNLSRETLRSITFMRDPYMLSYKDFRYYDLFFAALSSSLGFGITIICWFYLPGRKIRRNYLKTFAVSTSFFVTIFALAIISRFGSVLSVVVYNLPGYDNHLDILNDLWLLLILIPIYILQKRYAERTTNLVSRLKKSFQTNKTVPLDTLILEKIVIHNRNEQQFTWHRPVDSTEQNWSYALPEEVYAQILKHDVNSPSAKVLFEIMSEQIAIFTAYDIGRRNVEDYPEAEIERYYFKRNMLRKTSTIQSRLKQVAEKLQSNDKYKRYHHLISGFELNETWEEPEAE